MFNFWKKKKDNTERFGKETPYHVEQPIEPIKSLDPPVTQKMLDEAWSKTFQKPQPYDSIRSKGTMDSAIAPMAPQLGNYYNTVPPGVAMYFATQGFIGWQMCAILFQHWLIAKACIVPAQDAFRNGWDVTRNDGESLTPKELDDIRKYDEEFLLKDNLHKFIVKGRCYGVRIAKFIIESDDPKYYEKPFNIDGVKPGSFKGIVQVDPQWVSPELDMESGGNPNSEHFYEPTWWNIGGQRVHRTHLVVYRTEDLPDVLKPTYYYGGMPIPQKIFMRVYAAERVANEAPMLAITKRLTIIKTDLTRALANQAEFDRRMAIFTAYQDNHSVKVGGKTDDYQQFDTSLTDFDTVLMTQYQLVAAGAEMPATKLLQTSPKGFNATGEYDESSYHETLESLRGRGGTPFLTRYYNILIKSHISPSNPFTVIITWKPLDAMTAKEKAEVNAIKAETGVKLMSSGAINGDDERKRIVADPESDYNGLIDDSISRDLDDDEGFNERETEMGAESRRGSERDTA